VFSARKPFHLGSGNQAAVAQQRGRCVMVVTRNSYDIHINLAAAPVASRFLLGNNPSTQLDEL
jgi:hypothetical protein